MFIKYGSLLVNSDDILLFQIVGSQIYICRKGSKKLLLYREYPTYKKANKAFKKIQKTVR